MPASWIALASSSVISWPTSTDDLAGDRIEDVLGATRPTMRSRSGSMISPPSLIADDVDAVDRAAVVLVDDHVLGDVDQTAREVAGVGGLERGVGQTLARAVRRDEVLQHRQAFAEVGGDRRLDDLARGLGHQAAHAGELADLLACEPRAPESAIMKIGLNSPRSLLDLLHLANISSETFSVTRSRCR